MGNVARLDGIDRFVGFLDHVMSNGQMRLLAIPWAAIRRAKRRYRSYELIERGVLLGMRCPLKRILMLRCRHTMLLCRVIFIGKYTLQHNEAAKPQRQSPRSRGEAFTICQGAKTGFSATERELHFSERSLDFAKHCVYMPWYKNRTFP